MNLPLGLDGQYVEELKFVDWRHIEEILLPSARHLEEGRGTTILELLRLENCISTLCPRPLGSHPPPPTPK